MMKHPVPSGADSTPLGTAWVPEGIPRRNPAWMGRCGCVPKRARDRTVVVGFGLPTPCAAVDGVPHLPCPPGL